MLSILTVTQLQAVGVEPELENAPLVKIETSKGDVIIALVVKQSPITVNNFLNYVKDGFYQDTIFHRVIANFMIQGGGLTESLYIKPSLPAIQNESKNGLSNRRGTISMARTDDPNSATNQFFINIIDSERLDANSGEYGYTVFGYVVQGMDVVDKISKVATAPRGMHADVPIEPVKIINIEVVKE